MAVDFDVRLIDSDLVLIPAVRLEQMQPMKPQSKLLVKAITERFNLAVRPHETARCEDMPTEQRIFMCTHGPLVGP
ncbi:hypothetical protein [Halocatena pleomorpha]|uniref:Uncharacterized protein n=1 Tax=Halocatena pleomorpha TaxID=1785090 RepID=A0A3P3RD20_9EURY|nr:hypothetical protein [Halocatena pleomorpha]RRJ31392.1 hypothetical protein EIK79_06640 [Halocatena pleomorpha]